MKEIEKALKRPIFDEEMIKYIEKIQLQSHNTLKELINNQNNYLLILNEIKNLPSSSSSQFSIASDLLNQVVLTITEIIAVGGLVCSISTGNILTFLESILTLGLCFHQEYLNFQETIRLMEQKKELEHYFDDEFEEDLAKFLELVHEWGKNVYLFFIVYHNTLAQHEIILTLLNEEAKIRKQNSGCFLVKFDISGVLLTIKENELPKQFMNQNESFIRRISSANTPKQLLVEI